MSNSPLVTYTALSPNHYDGRKGYRVDTITPHYMGGNCTVETCGNIFAPASRRASSNYGVGSDGRSALYVDESDGAWTSGSWRNDCRAITIECANLADGSLTNACWNSLVQLCADICRRHGFKGVQYTGSPDHSQQADGYMLLTMHRWFQETDCPGDWLTSRFGKLANDVNAAMASGVAPRVKPKNNTQGGKLDVDGVGGYNTVLDMQHALGTWEDGVISGQWKPNHEHFRSITSVEWGAQGSPMVAALQRLIGAVADGVWGEETSKALQQYLIDRGYKDSPADGDFGEHAVKALQRCLNDGRFAK